MKPLHHEVVRLSRCPCCHSKYSRKKNMKCGKSAARHATKQAMFKELSQ